MLDYLDVYFRVYLDDIIVYNQILKEHEKHLRMVFQRGEHMLNVKSKKFEIPHRQITFLGHKISACLIRMDESKVRAIKE